jgi:hypothetical protein
MNEPQTHQADQKSLIPAGQSDPTYGGAFALTKGGNPGKPVGVVTFVATKLGYKNLTSSTKLSDLTKQFGKDAVRSAKRELAQNKTVRAIHDKKTWALIGADPNLRCVVTGKTNAKGEFIGFDGRARFMKPETAKKLTKDAEIAMLRERLAAAGISV